MKRSISVAVNEALADLNGFHEFNDINLRVRPGMNAEECEAAYFARVEAVNRLYAQLVVESTDIPAPIVERAIVTLWKSPAKAIDAESRAAHSAFRAAERELFERFLADDSKFAAIATAIVEHGRKARQRAGEDSAKLNEAWLEFHELVARHHSQEHDILKFRFLQGEVLVISAATDYRYVPYRQV